MAVPLTIAFGAMPDTPDVPLQPSRSSRPAPAVPLQPSRGSLWDARFGRAAQGEGDNRTRGMGRFVFC